MRNLHHIRRAMLHDTREDTVFLGMADLLTLLSICFIFVALQLPVAPQGGISEGVRAVKAGLGSGPSRKLDDTVAYIGVLPMSGRLMVRIMFPVDESMHERFVAAQVPGDEERQTIDWIVSTCASRKNVKKIVLHLDRERAPDSAHRFTNNIASALKEPYEVIQAFR